MIKSFRDINLLFEKIRRKLGNSYRFNTDEIVSLFLIQAMHRVLRARIGKKKLITALSDNSFFGPSEAFSDIGFIQSDTMPTFFGGDPANKLHPFNPLSDLEKYNFDVIINNCKRNPLGHVDTGKAIVIDLGNFIQCTKQAFKKIKKRNFLSCLNLNKIGIIASLAYFFPYKSNILEVGSYQCGTTIFLAELCSLLGKEIKVFACDTFEGMPPATEQDKRDPIYYDSGMFTDNHLEKVKKRIKEQKLEDTIQLIKGDASLTVPQLIKDGYRFSFMFLDTDQYKGTKAGLDAVSGFNVRDILIDDTSLSSVSLAIDEFLGENTEFTRKNLITNFDYVFSATQ